MMERLQGPASQGVPVGFLLVMLKPGRARLRYRRDLIAGYFWSEHDNATLLYVQGVQAPFTIWEMPDEVDTLMDQPSAVLPTRPAAAPVNGGRRHVERRTA